jgi:CPA2 family monovalent cation:H+ antiporter-2
MALTPFAFVYAHQITERLARTPIPQPVRERLQGLATETEGDTAAESLPDDHLVVIGYGINGRNLARAARQADIPYTIVELNPDTVRTAREAGEPIVFGDATQETLLQHIHVQKARVVVIAISDPVATKRIVAKVRELNPAAYLIVRTRYVAEIPENLHLGANEVIPEEFETSVEIFTRVLYKYLVPRGQVRAFAEQIRARNYQMFRSPGETEGQVLQVPDIEIATLAVQQGNNRIVGKSLAESRLRQEFGINILAIWREGSYLTHFGPDEVIRPDDILYVLGKPEQIAALNQRLII